ncbi:hypothetical protein BLNAU_4452 [Blattamonas nauphoetae]|uniref:AIG1-type G domain-containing protein n=1 Tax=Blattamonas nauphoetae TaxID=2049346 RepID=A0ABQ9YA24_9EUKA|nr:hypothetical protein BLNAU_4452 [Blattamonas nauphoetae]
MQMPNERPHILLIGPEVSGKTTLWRTLGIPETVRSGVILPGAGTDAPQSALINWKGCPVEVIDTSGIPSNEQEERDALEQITHFLKNSPQVNLICYVLTIAEYRASDGMFSTLQYIRNMFGRTDVWSHMCVVVTHSERQSEIFGENHDIFQTYFKPGLESFIDAEYENERTDPIRLFFVDSKVGQMDPETELELDQLIEFASSLNPLPTTNLIIPDPLIHKLTHYQETNIVSEQTVPRLIEVTHTDGTVAHAPDGEVKTTVTETRYLTKCEYAAPLDPTQPDQYCIVSEEREPEYSVEEEIIGATMLRKHYCLERDFQVLRAWTLVTWLDGTTSIEDEEEENLFQPQDANEANRDQEWMAQATESFRLIGAVFDAFVPIGQLLADTLS